MFLTCKDIAKTETEINRSELAASLTSSVRATGPVQHQVVVSAVLIRNDLTATGKVFRIDHLHCPNIFCLAKIDLPPRLSLAVCA